MDQPQGLSVARLTLKATVVHTVTYFIAGLTAFLLLDYDQRWAEEPLSLFMRPLSHPIYMAGPALQVIRGVIFGLALWPIRELVFGRERGWLVMWWLLVALGILSTFGPSPGSVEGLIYTVMPMRVHLGGMPEVLIQSLAFSFILHRWVTRPKAWMAWVLGILMLVGAGLPLLGLLAQE
jgi:hypothetical protein